jgi:hypothetical protein
MYDAKSMRDALRAVNVQALCRLCEVDPKTVYRFRSNDQYLPTLRTFDELRRGLSLLAQKGGERR